MAFHLGHTPPEEWVSELHAPLRGMVRNVNVRPWEWQQWGREEKQKTRAGSTRVRPTDTGRSREDSARCGQTIDRVSSASWKWLVVQWNELVFHEWLCHIQRIHPGQVVLFLERAMTLTSLIWMRFKNIMCFANWDVQTVRTSTKGPWQQFCANRNLQFGVQWKLFSVKTA